MRECYQSMKNPDQKHLNFGAICKQLEAVSLHTSPEKILPVVEFVDQLYPERLEISYISSQILYRVEYF